MKDWIGYLATLGSIGILPSIIGFYLGTLHGDTWYRNFFVPYYGEDERMKRNYELIWGITGGSMGFSVSILLYGLLTYPKV